MNANYWMVALKIGDLIKNDVTEEEININANAVFDTDILMIDKSESITSSTAKLFSNCILSFILQDIAPEIKRRKVIKFIEVLSKGHYEYEINTILIDANIILKEKEEESQRYKTGMKLETEKVYLTSLGIRKNIMDYKWFIGVIIIPLLAIFIPLFQFNGPKDADSSANITAGDNSFNVTGKDNKITNNTNFIISTSISEKTRSLNMPILMESITLDTPISYVQEKIGSPQIYHKDVDHSSLGVFFGNEEKRPLMNYMVYHGDNKYLKIGTFDDKTIESLAFIITDTTSRIIIKNTPIILGETKFVCMASARVTNVGTNRDQGVFSHKYMASLGNYCYSCIGTHLFTMLTPQWDDLLYIDFKLNEDVKINFASIAREEKSLSCFIYGDF